MDASVHALAVGVASGVSRRARLSAELYACTSIAAGLAEEHGDDYSDLSPGERYVYVRRAISVETADRQLAMDGGWFSSFRNDAEQIDNIRLSASSLACSCRPAERVW